MVPRINDITTSTEKPPHFVALARQFPRRDYTYPSSFSAQQTGYYRDLAPLLLNHPRAQVFAWIDELARKQARWSIIESDVKTLRLEAVAVTRLMRYRDDVVIEVRESPSANDSQCEVQMRSKSRLGKSDLGANAKRIEDFFDQLRQKAQNASKK